MSPSLAARSAALALTALLGILTSVCQPIPVPYSPTGRPGEPVAWLFLSSNTEEQLALPAAVERLRSPVHAHFRTVAAAILDQLSVDRYHVLDGVGDWSDGAENSLLVVLSRPTDEATLRYAAVWFGLLARQKSVLAFSAEPTGPDSLAILELPPGHLSSLRRSLDLHGIPCRTLVFAPGGQRVFVLDAGRVLTDRLRQFATTQGVRLTLTRGRGFSVGETTRGRARALYQQEIRQYEDRTARRLQPNRLPLLAHGR